MKRMQPPTTVAMFRAVRHAGNPLSSSWPICQIQYATSARSRSQPKRSHALRDTDRASHLDAPGATAVGWPVSSHPTRPPDRTNPR